MILQGITQEAFISSVEVKLDAEYTEEQKELIKLFGEGPVFCFADPGTGKTYTAIGGLLNAELFKGIPGDNIYALSFTKLATGELAVRHERACSKLGITRRVNFQTLHSLCRTILKENYRKLGLTRFESTGSMPIETAFNIIQGSLDEWGESVPPNKIRSIVAACNELNSALIFDQDIVMSKMCFKKLDIDYDLFDRIRGILFAYALYTETISVSDLLLYTVMLMQKFPEVSRDFKAKCKLMLVDEAQDLSLLQLRIISMLTDNPVFIGDMKQQIYAFNGACQEVVEAFKTLYPNCVTTKLTQSFRCKQDIADYATKIILHNNIGGEDFKGVSEGGTVKLCHGLLEDGVNIVSLAEELHNTYVANSSKFDKSYMFLARNNMSLLPIIEELYKQSLPFRVNKFTPAYEVPLIKELTELLKLVDNPYDYSNILALRYLIPEFRGYYSLQSHPFYQICKQLGCSIFEVNYQFKNPAVGGRAMNLLSDATEMIGTATVGTLFNHFWPMFEENWVHYTEWKLDNKPNYYLQSVNSLTRKTFSKFIQDEVKKDAIANESERYGRGVRCYTMHASKGLEADVVYIIDADEGILPNERKLLEMEKADCQLDVARAIREERSLCYVACTRAKSELYIVSNGKPAPIILGENTYSDYDYIYNIRRGRDDNIEAFDKFVERHVKL